MNNKTLHIRDIIADSDFQKMQDEIAVATNAAVITVDYSGTPVTNHSLCSDFCRLVRSNPKYKHLCEKCDSRGGVEAARLKKPYVYLCHMGLSDFAVPVIIDDVYVGAVMAGQILIEESDKDKLERILSEKSECKGDTAYSEAYSKLPVMSLDKVIALSNIISYLSNSFLREILMTKPQLTRMVAADDSGENSQRLKPLIAPALQYIDKNYRNNLNLNDVAACCGVSGGYLSRIFTRAVGCNFSHYVNAVRIAHSKELLARTNNSVASIALDLGYEDCGYFIKVFKRMENMTPNEFRAKNQHKQLIDELKRKNILI